MTAADMHLDTGAAALDSLPFDEANSFVAHLETCTTCSEELIGFLETAALLGMAEASTPPARLRGAVLAAARITPQLPPLVALDFDAPPTSASGPTGPSGPIGPSGPEGTPVTRPQLSALPGTGQPAPRSARQPWYRRPQAFLAAAAAAVVIAGTVTVISLNSADEPTPVASCVVSAADRQTRSPSDGLGGVAVVSPSCRQALVTPAGLGPLPTGSVYQLWAIGGSGVVRSIGVLETNPDGTLKAREANLQQDDATLAISVEPGPNGSDQPTTTPRWLVPIA